MFQDTIWDLKVIGVEPQVSGRIQGKKKESRRDRKGWSQSPSTGLEVGLYSLFWQAGGAALQDRSHWQVRMSDPSSS